MHNQRMMPARLVVQLSEISSARMLRHALGLRTRVLPSLRVGASAACLRTVRRPLSSGKFDAADDIDIDSVAYGFMASQALFTGLETGVFDAISAAGEGGLTLDKLQQSTSITAPRLQTLVTSLVAALLHAFGAIELLAADGSKSSRTPPAPPSATVSRTGSSSSLSESSEPPLVARPRSVSRTASSASLGVLHALAQLSHCAAQGKVGSGFDSMSEDERRGGGDDSDEVGELDEEATAAALAGRTSSRSLQAAVVGAGGRDDDGSESPPVQPWSAEELMGGS